MEKAYEYAKQAVVNFKLDRCCCLAPIRVGVFIVGYFNMFIAVLSLLGTADGGISPPLMEVQELILEDNSSKALGIFAYSVELAFSTLLQCAMYRNDIVLLRVYLWFTVTQTLAELILYSMLMVLISLLTKILIFLKIIFNVYVILIVFSAIVEIRQTRYEKNRHVVLYSLAKTEEQPVDIEGGKQNVTEKEHILEKVEIEDKNDKAPMIEDKVTIIENKKDKILKTEDKKDELPKIEDKKDKVLKTDDKKDEVTKFGNIKNKVLNTEGKKDKVSKIEDKKEEVLPIEDKKDEVKKFGNIINKVLRIESKKDKVSKIEDKKHEVLQIEDKKDEEKTKMETLTKNPKE